jgi:hypothetical protein
MRPMSTALRTYLIRRGDAYVGMNGTTTDRAAACRYSKTQIDQRRLDRRTPRFTTEIEDLDIKTVERNGVTITLEPSFDMMQNRINWTIRIAAADGPLVLGCYVDHTLARRVANAHTRAAASGITTVAELRETARADLKAQARARKAVA